jgi:hypothetical protein
MSEITTNPLDAYSVDDLLEAVLERQSDMLDNKGRLSWPAFRIADFVGTRVCVDGAAVRLNDEGDPEMMGIVRGTGPNKGRICLVGGGVGRVLENDIWVPESVEEAMTRHFDTDLKMKVEPLLSWDQPQHLAQDMRSLDNPDDPDGEVRPGFMPNPASRHLVAARYLVTVTEGADTPVFGSTDFGQEAIGVTWFTEREISGENPKFNSDQFGYGHDQTYRSLFRIADRHLDLIPSAE